MRKSAPFICRATIVGFAIFFDLSATHADQPEGIPPVAHTSSGVPISGAQSYIDPGQMGASTIPIAPYIRASLRGNPNCLHQATQVGSIVEPLVISNYGEVNLVGFISVIDFPGLPALSISCIGPFSIPRCSPAMICSVTMESNGAPEGVYQGKISIAHNDASQASPIEFPIDFTIDNGGCIISPAIFTELSFDPDCIFSAANTDSIVQTVTIANVGNANLNGLVSVTDFPGLPQLLIACPGAYSIPVAGADRVCTVIMRANGAAAGPYSGTISITHNNFAQPSPIAIPIDFHVDEQLCLIASSIDARLTADLACPYHASQAGSNEEILTIANVGNANLVGSIAVSADFPGLPQLSVSCLGPYSMQPCDPQLVCTVTMESNGAPEGTYSAQISISHNGAFHASPIIFPIEFIVDNGICPNCTECPCASDANCDGTICDVLDVVATVGVAFRSGTPVNDGDCPRERTDVDCSGNTDVLDVIRTINVAFRGFDKSTEFCDPCL